MPNNVIKFNKIPIKIKSFKKNIYIYFQIINFDGYQQMLFCIFKDFVPHQMK